MTKDIVTPADSTLTVKGDFVSQNPISIKVYAQATEPSLGADQQVALWEKTGGSPNPIYLIYRRGVDDHVLIELGSSSQPHNQIHALGGSDHSASILSELNSKISDANVDDENSTRPPSAHTHIEADITDLDHTDIGAERTTNKDQPNGYPGLDGSSKLNGAQQTYGTGTNTACEGNDSRLTKFIVSSDDTTPGDAENKFTATANKIALTTTSPGGDEKRNINVGIDILDIKAGGQFTSVNEKVSLKGSDKCVMEDSEDSNNKKYWRFSNLPFPKAYIDGFNISHSTTVITQIFAGRCRDSNDNFNIVNGTTLNVDITASGANGLDTGTEAANTIYYVHVCLGPSGVCGLYSLSRIAPALPTGYTTAFRCVGAVANDDSSNIIPFSQIGRGRLRFTQYNYDRISTNLEVLAAGNSTSWANIDCSEVVPETAIMIQGTFYSFYSLAQYAEFRPSGFTSADDGLIFTVNDNEGVISGYLVNVDEEIKYKVTNSNVDVWVYVVGYIEEV